MKFDYRHIDKVPPGYKKILKESQEIPTISFSKIKSIKALDHEIEELEKTLKQAKRDRDEKAQKLLSSIASECDITEPVFFRSEGDFVLFHLKVSESTPAIKREMDQLLTRLEETNPEVFAEIQTYMKGWKTRNTQEVETSMMRIFPV